MFGIFCRMFHDFHDFHGHPIHQSTKADEVVLEFLGRLDGQVLGSFLNAVVSKGFQDGSPQK